MPIVRSEFTIEQFEAVIQQIACDVVQKETGVSCKAKQGKFRMVKMDKMTFEFRYGKRGCHRISVRYHKETGKWTCWRCSGETFTEAEVQKHIDEKHDGEDWTMHPIIDSWSFTVEPKIYFSSNHSTKLDVSDDKERVLKWISKVMADVKPVPRFSLSEHAKAT